MSQENIPTTPDWQEFSTSQSVVQVPLSVGRHVLELVVIDDNGRESAPDTVTIIIEALAFPAITEFVIESGDPIPGASDVRATIKGTNLMNVNGITFYKTDGSVDGAITYSNLTARAEAVSLILQIAADAQPGPRRFSLTISGSTSLVQSGSVGFTVERPLEPFIESIDPAESTVDKTEVHTIKGYLPGATRVQFSGVDITASIKLDGTTDESLLVYITPDLWTEPGKRTYSVTTSKGIVNSSAEGLLVIVPRPSIGDVTPRYIIGLNGSIKITGEYLIRVKSVWIESRSSLTAIWTPAKWITVHPIEKEEDNGLSLDVTFSLTGYPVPRYNKIVVQTQAGEGSREFTLPSTFPSLPGGGLDRGVEEVIGIGDVRKTQLEKAGITTLPQLAGMEPVDLAKVLSISNERAAEFIDSAKNLLTG